jgi:hypothetical protein
MSTSDKTDCLKWTPDVTSDKPRYGDHDTDETTSDKTQSAPEPRHRGRQPGTLPARYAAIHATYEADLAEARMLDDDTRRAYTAQCLDT